MSQTATREAQRWSLAGQAVVSPALIAGLPEGRARVRVGPPLLAKAASLGSSGAALVPARSPLVPFVIPLLPVVSPIRLWPPETIVPHRSGVPVLDVFPATSVFVSVTVVLLLTLAMPAL